MFSTVDPFTREINCCALGMTDGNVYIWDTRRKECSVTFENAHQDGILDVRLLNRTNANSYDVISGSKDGIIKIWNIDSGDLIQQYNLPVPKSRRVRGMLFPRAGLSQPAHFFQSAMEHSCFVSYDHLINHIDLETGKTYSVFGEASDDGPGWVTCFSCVSPSLLATAGSSRKVSLWDLRTPDKPVSTISDQHKEWIRCLQLHGWNHSLATGCSDAMVRIFDLRKQSVLVSSFGPHAGSKQRPGRVNSLQMDFDKIVRVTEPLHCHIRSHIFLSLTDLCCEENNLRLRSTHRTAPVLQDSASNWQLHGLGAQIRSILRRTSNRIIYNR
jgi:WD40 repeat protein